jgi:hypothetical protein
VTPGLLLALTLGLPLGMQPYNPFCLGHEPKARITTTAASKRNSGLMPSMPVALCRFSFLNVCYTSTSVMTTFNCSQSIPLGGKETTWA